MMPAVCIFICAATLRSIVLGVDKVEEVTEKPDNYGFCPCQKRSRTCQLGRATLSRWCCPSGGHRKLLAGEDRYRGGERGLKVPQDSSLFWLSRCSNSWRGWRRCGEFWSS